MWAHCSWPAGLYTGHECKSHSWLYATAWVEGDEHGTWDLGLNDAFAILKRAAISGVSGVGI